ncbi:hypothetical protein KJ766_02275 [Patescibacteria group bacterium]|nr:hypothetical protein [Patescibacteria group bacterium]
MKGKKGLFMRSVQPLIGSVIGVGIFGLPFVFAQSGFLIGLVHLILIAIVNLVVLLVYADLIVKTDGHHRLTGLVKEYAGNVWGHASTILMFGSTWGAMIAYIIIGGEFLQALAGGTLGGSLIVYQIIFFAVSSLVLVGGLGFVSRLEVFFVAALIIMLGVIMLGAMPEANFQNLTYIQSSNWFLPFGVVLFAFGGMAAIPEMAHILGRKKSKLPKAVILGMSIVACIYLLFALVVVSVTGIGTTEEAILGLGSAIGDWALWLGAVVGLFSVFTSFLILGLSVMDTMIYDYKMRYMTSWFIAIIFPLIIFLFGARSFIDVIGFTGAVLGGLVGIIMLASYRKAQKHPGLLKRSLNWPLWVLVLCGIVYAIGVILTIFGF